MKEGPRGFDCEYEIEHHFMPKDIIEDRIDDEVEIVEVKEKGELLIESEPGNPDTLVIGAGGLALKLQLADFARAWSSFLLSIEQRKNDRQ
jgi:hypothetical protein